MERILVPLDGSELSEHAVPVAARLARALGARVILLRVVPPPRVSVPETAGDLPPLVDLEERQADEYLRAHEPAFAGIPVERVVLVGPHAAEEIIAWMRAHPVDYVVMATHGHGGLRHLITGSVTEAVLRSGLAPVIAVRPVPTASTARR
jgi:nucleotide-binding universal stress UspA family protein